MMKSLHHEQAPMPSGCEFVCSNQSLWCFRILKNKHAVEAHVTRAFKIGRCQKAQLKDSKLSIRGTQINANDICFFSNSVRLILTICLSTTRMRNYMEALALANFAAS